MTTLASEQSGMLLSEQQEASKAAERAAVAEKEAAIARTAEEVAKQATTRAEKETAIARTAEAEAIRMAEEAKQATMRLGKHFLYTFADHLTSIPEEYRRTLSSILEDPLINTGILINVILLTRIAFTQVARLKPIRSPLGAVSLHFLPSDLRPDAWALPCRPV